jgi:hypothetical protein
MLFWMVPDVLLRALWLQDTLSLADARLTFCGRTLDSSMPLRSCGVKALQTLDVLHRLRGGGEADNPPEETGEVVKKEEVCSSFPIHS